MKDVQKIIADLKKDGAKTVTAIIKNAVVTKVVNDDDKPYLRFAITLDTEVPAYVEENGEYREGTSRFVYLLSGSLGHFLSNNEETAFIKDAVCARPKWAKAILTYSKVTLLCEKVKAKQSYSNPFSEKEEKVEIENDNIYHHMIDFELGSMAKKHAAKFTEHLLFNEEENED